MRHLPILTLIFCLTAAPAHAAPLGAAIGLFSGALGWIGSTAVGAFFLRTAAAFAISALSTALSSRPGEAQQRGVEAKATTSGGTQPQTIIMGRYATGGNAAAPPMTHGRDGGDIIEFLNYVFDLSDFRITGVDWVYVDGEKQRFAGGPEYYGIPATGTRFAGNSWLRWYDGTQTAADGMLVDVYDEYTRPWTPDHILKGVGYAVVSFKYDPEKFQGFPKMRFEVRGAPLYDPRRDDTLGGSGPQRWGDQDTWEYTENPVVMVYNILRGIALEDGSVYGVGADFDDLPLGRWVAAMNTCDELVPTPEGDQPRYRAGTEFSIDQEPLDVVSEILKSAGGRVAESGGAWNISVGPAPFPVASFTDESIIASDPREFEPFRGLNSTYNGLHASYLNPQKNWQARDAAPYYRADLEAEDGGRRLIAELRLPTVTERRQVQRLMQEMLLDNRRMTIHSLTLPPNALGILPLDTLTWSSANNGYSNKLFEVQTKTVDPATLNVRVTIRERDVADYSYDYEYAPDLPELPTSGEDIQDGAPEDGEPDAPYVDPVDGTTPLDPVEPAPGTGALVALHSDALNRSNDAGATWTHTPVPLNACSDISALENDGFVILAASGAHFSRDTRGWDRLDFSVQDDIDIGLTNGGFESADLTAWSTETGAPQVIDTSAPAQQGGEWYLTGQDYAVEQTLELPAWDAEEVVIAADAYAGGTSTATLSVVVTEALPQLTGNGNITSGLVVNYATAPDGGQLDLHVVSGGGGLTSSGEGLSTLELRYTDGTAYNGPWLIAVGLSRYDSFGVLDGDFIELLLPPGSDAEFDNLPGANQYYDGAEVRYPNNYSHAGIVTSANPCSVNVGVLTGSVDITAGSYTAFYNAYETGQVTLGTVTANRPAWETLSIKGNFQGKRRVRIRLEGTGSEAYFDNVRAYVQETNADAPQAVASDHLDRRHLVACVDGLHAVDGDGVVTALGSVPFAPVFLAGRGDTILIAAGTDIAISSDNGTTWSQHTASALVRQLFATPTPAAVLANGDVVSVSAGGLTAESSLGEDHWLAYARRPGEWLAVDRAGAMQAGGLSVWASGTDQPAAAVASARRVLAVEAGRRIGWVDGGRDIFYRDLSDAAWSLGYPLLDDIRALKEVK